VGPVGVVGVDPDPPQAANITQSAEAHTQFTAVSRVCLIMSISCLTLLREGDASGFTSQKINLSESLGPGIGLGNAHQQAGDFSPLQETPDIIAEMLWDVK
jgi:hypothetical protein